MSPHVPQGKLYGIESAYQETRISEPDGRVLSGWTYDVNVSSSKPGFSVFVEGELPDPGDVDHAIKDALQVVQHYYALGK